MDQIGKRVGKLVSWTPPPPQVVFLELNLPGGASSTALLGRLRRRGAGRGRQGGEAADGHADAAHGRQEGGRGDVREALVLVQGELLGWFFTFMNPLSIFLTSLSWNIFSK